MIYVLKLPSGLLKLGRGNLVSRRSCAQQFFDTPVTCPAVWEHQNEVWAEFQAHLACGLYHVVGELFRAEADEAVRLISAVLGEPAATNLSRRRRGRPRKGVLTIHSDAARQCDLV